ncbi:hypothetical protein [uncultured Olegusella sp.]|uniref:DUF7601 domain-containing protein n=1 Tax=uncultured Olegusella sp. TaxID=1979846 RepID=UPI00261C25E1|nr:hypothetical protein [uncultured Olegusella sp.]
MKKQRKIVGIALAALLALSLTPVSAHAVTAIPNVEKTLNSNPGTTVTATFKFEATPVALSTGNGNEQTYMDGPDVTINDITLTNATNTENNNGSTSIVFSKNGMTGEAAFPHAGIYAWTIKETPNTYNGIGTVDYDSQVYTLIVSIGNGNNGLTYESVVVVKGEATSVTNDNKESGGAIPFVNKYTKKTDDDTAKNVDLKIDKKVEGNQGDKTKMFDFTITFTAPDVLPNGKDAATVLNDITTAVANGAEVTPQAASGTTRTFTFKAHDASDVTFQGILEGTTYTISETAVDGYNQSYSAVANGQNSTEQANLLIGENENKGSMTNTYNDVTPTGLVLNNLPFILMGGMAIAGVVLYGAAKRKLEQ